MTHLDPLQSLMDAKTKIDLALEAYRNPNNHYNKTVLELELVRDELRRIKSLTGDFEIVQLCERGLREGQFTWQKSAAAIVSNTIEPSEVMCDAARGILIGFEVRIYDFEDMTKHLKRGDYYSPLYLEGKTGHITKWEQAILVWQAMQSAIQGKDGI